MSFTYFKKSIRLSRFLVLIYLLYTPGILFAVEQSPQKESLKLSVQPSIIRIDLAVGGIWQGVLRVNNQNNQTLKYDLKTMSYAKGQSGGFAPTLSADAADPLGATASWIELSKNFVTIKPGRSVEVPFRIKVPEIAVPGDYRAAILVGLLPGQTGEGVSIGTKSYVSTGIAMHLTGRPVNAPFLREFSIDQSWYLNSPVTFHIVLTNQDSVPVLAYGKLNLSSPFGFGGDPDEIKLVLPIIKPTQSAVFDVIWQPKDGFPFGFYRANLALAYGGDQATPLVDSVNFWIIPAPFLAVAVILFLIFLFAIWLGFYHGRQKLGSKKILK